LDPDLLPLVEDRLWRCGDRCEVIESLLVALQSAS
jgi:hypothetical protein